jgi:SAM-dependent methyltransferase
MSTLLSTAVTQLRRRCHRWLGGDFDYRVAYRKADLDRSPWTVIGASTKEEFDTLGRVKKQLLIGQGLTPDSRVLDVGCGTGALTIPLLDYLSPRGLYHGTDIAPEAIAFCREHFRRPNFVFECNDLTRLPIEGIQFDFIYFGSVFTHIYPDEIRDLLVEVARLLDPRGLIIGDLFVDPGIDRFRGDRGMVVINEDYLHERLAATGLAYELLGGGRCAPEDHDSYRKWPCTPQTRRLTYKLARDAAALRRGPDSR